MRVRARARAGRWCRQAGSAWCVQAAGMAESFSRPLMRAAGGFAGLFPPISTDYRFPSLFDIYIVNKILHYIITLLVFAF